MRNDMTRRRFLRLACLAGAAGAMGALDACAVGGTASTEAESAAAASTVEAASPELAEDVVPNYAGTIIPSFTNRTGDSYAIGAYLRGGSVAEDHSCLASYVATEDSGLVISNVSIDAQGSGFTALTLQGTGDDGSTTASLKGVDITAADDEDGTNCSDFTGLGSVVVASGVNDSAHNLVTLDDVTMSTTGFARDAVVVNDYADAVITNSSIVVNGADPRPGGDIYEAYRNSANTSYMVSPPWILGITGGARGTNMFGKQASLSLVSSYVEAGAWAVLSTDSCTSPVLNVVNSELRIANEGTDHGLPGGSGLFGYSTPYGSGYGTYAIGGAVENFYGARFTDVTYATIMTGSGELYYGPSTKSLELKNAKGDTVLTFDGDEQNTVVNAVWGLMDHQGGTATLDGGSEWNTEEATILKKGTSSSTYTISGASISPASGIIFQMMDDDDGYGTSGTGGDTSATTYDGTAWGSPTFSGGFWETAGVAGLPSKLGNLATGGSVTSTVNLKSGIYAGDLLNGAGSGAGVDASGLAVSLSGATLDGRISSVETVHGLLYSKTATDYLDRLAAEYGDGVAYQGGTSGPNGDGTYTVSYALLDEGGAVVVDAESAAFIQVLEFTCKEYYLIGHVVDFPVAGATAEVTVADKSTWNVTGDCYLTYLEVEDGSSVSVADGATLHVAGESLTGDVSVGTYGTKTVAASGGAQVSGSTAPVAGDPGTAPSGEAPGGGSGAGGTPPSGGMGPGSDGSTGSAPADMGSGTPPTDAAGMTGGSTTDASTDATSVSADSDATLDVSHVVRLTVTRK